MHFDDNYYGVANCLDDGFEHYGTKYHSGRYPYGSGEDPHQHDNLFLSQVKEYREEFKKQGMPSKDIDTAIAKKMGYSTNEFRNKRMYEKARQRDWQIETAKHMREDGKSNVEIGKRLGMTEGNVRALLREKTQTEKEKATQFNNTTDKLKDAVDKYGYLDVGLGVSTQLGVSKNKLNSVVDSMVASGEYYKHKLYVQSLTNKDHWTDYEVLTKNPDKEDVYKNHLYDIRYPDFYTKDSGKTWSNINPPVAFPLDRVKIAPQSPKDGVIEVRPGVDGLSLGESNYAQGRILLENGLYAKGMIVYNKNLPKGCDLLFNTNKASTDPEKVFKPAKKDINDPTKIDANNPFGATINRQNKKADGSTGYLNLIRDEGDWYKWSHDLSAQFLAKQPINTIKNRLSATTKATKDELDSIRSITNPLVKQQELMEFALGCETKAVDLKAVGTPGMRTHVLLPVNSIKPNEVYAPNYHDGDRLLLVRYPHAGPFESPELIVNNKCKEAKETIGSNAIDALGIHPSVANKLSGADFDGDFVLAIKNNNHMFKSAPSLPGLKDFDPKDGYSVGHKTISKEQKNTQMGVVSNLITDMTIRGATSAELERAVKHSMVVIDSEKHQLDWRKSEEVNGIDQLRQKYQKHPNGKYGGASTLLSLAGSDLRGPKYDKNGNPVISKKTGEPITNAKLGKRMALTDDAYTLSSGTAVENAYAKFANEMKAMAKEADAEAKAVKLPKVDKEAKAKYASEVATLQAKLNGALLNKPRERQAQLLTSKIYNENKRDDWDKKEASRARAQFEKEARARVDSNARQYRIKFTPKEWEAVQANAISSNMLRQLLYYADNTAVRKMATPAPKVAINASRLASAKTMLARGKTQAEVADQLGVSVSTLRKALAGE